MEEDTKKIVEEITEKRKMTQIVKEKLNTRIFKNCLLGIGIIIAISILNFIYIYASDTIVSIALKVFPMIFIILTIITFEISYRKDNGIVAITAIELLVFSIIVLYMPNIYENLDKKFCLRLACVPLICAFYYIIKSVIIYFATEKHYQNNLSDVKEIMKDE